MKLSFLLLLISFVTFGQVTFNEPKTQVKHEVLTFYLDEDNNSFVSKQELKFTDFLKLDSERDDNWHSEINELYNHPKVKAMVNLTKGEGYGRPLLEFTLVKKP